jgi:hypothetical protein
MNPFAFEWLVPSQADRLTHVTLLDRARPAPFSVAVGHGPDKAQALLCLWVTLKDDDAPVEAIDYVAAEYARRTGMVPKESPSDPGSARPTKRGLKKSVRR